MNKGNKTFNQLPLVLFFIFYNKCFYKPNTSVNKHSRKSSDQKLLKMTAEQPKDQQQPNKKITNTAEVPLLNQMKTIHNLLSRASS